MEGFVSYKYIIRATIFESNLFFTLSLWVIHVYIEILILFDENLLKITKKS
jgi:hypothetical protein